LRFRRYLQPLLAAAVVGWLAGGCASAPVHEPPEHPDAPAAATIALGMLGKPYRYGGDTPTKGFDCSGLVQYSYARAGVKIPRSTEQQRQDTRPVPPRKIKKGDLLFFDQQGKKFSHVGIYLGEDWFVHAPAGGKAVRKDRLTDPFWREHFVDARRVPVR
jgi:cell wall-associated NlpC family hydrolase